MAWGQGQLSARAYRGAAHIPATERWPVSAGRHRPQWPGGGCCAQQSASLCRPGSGRTAQHSAVSARGQNFTTLTLFTTVVPCCPVANLIQLLHQPSPLKPPTGSWTLRLSVKLQHHHVLICVFMHIYTHGRTFWLAKCPWQSGGWWVFSTLGIPIGCLKRWKVAELCF